MSNFYYELDVESVLQCPVCYDIPPNVIFMCKIGHHMCEKCRKKLTLCPSCQSPLMGTRNFLAEALVSKFSIFKGAGDAPDNNNVAVTRTNRTKLQENKSHLKTLPLSSGTYNCLLESCRNRNEMGAGHLISHVGTKHQHLFDKFQNNLATFSKTLESFCFIKGKRKYHRAFQISNMGLFFLNLEVMQDNYINYWLSFPGPVKITNHFDYEIDFSKEEDQNDLHFSSKVASSLQTTQWLLQRGRIQVIPPLEHNLKDKDIFTLHIKIVYNAPPQSDCTVPTP